MERVEVIVVGAGAAGLMCAIEAGARGRRVLLLDHNEQVGRKILISGGGRCNFTNLYAEADNFLSSNPHFVKSALARFSQHDFLARVEAHGIAWEEREHGQLFCKGSAREIVEMLVQQAAAAGVQMRLGCQLDAVDRDNLGFTLRSQAAEFGCDALVVATGGLSIPKLGSSHFGHQLARQFGLPLVAPQAALVPFRFTGQEAEAFMELAGCSLPVRASCNGATFTEAMLFTHRGLSGPAMLQLSSYWTQGEEIVLNLLPSLDLSAWLIGEKSRRPKLSLLKLLAERLPRRLVATLANFPDWGLGNEALATYANSSLDKLAAQLGHWRLRPAGTEGYRTAEATRGGVSTDALSSKTLEARQVPGLYFIGEVVDVTGQLGGFNFQWAWSSGYTAGQYA